MREFLKIWHNLPFKASAHKKVCEKISSLALGIVCTKVDN